MNDIGKLIEERRRFIGRSRAELATALGVSAQTILNVERDPDYNLGTKLLRRIEEALEVEFSVTMNERRGMAERITMGNDELLLHIRKHYNSTKTNQVLGQRIRIWLLDNADGEQVSKQEMAAWGEAIPAVSPTMLPGSGTHYEFRLDALPALYRFLGQLAAEV